MSYRLTMEILIFGSLGFCLAMLLIAWIAQQVDHFVICARRRAELRSRTSFSKTWIFERISHSSRYH